MKYLSKESRRSLTQQSDYLLNKLFPICRSLTGDGLRQTLFQLREFSSFDIKSVESGSQRYDWKVPKEWVIREAYIKDSTGKIIVDFERNNLHVMNYSDPINKKLSYDKLVKNLHTLPDLKSAIPYRTSYYSSEWGFCLTHEQFETLDRNETYSVVIDSEFIDGELNYGECLLKGKLSKKTYIFTSYPCHPSMANDNLSGVVLWVLLLSELKKKKLNNDYIFVLHPETIGAIAYLNKNEELMKKVDGGFVLTTVAGPGEFSIKKSIDVNSSVERAAFAMAKESKRSFKEYDFDPDAGSDERQYSSPFFRIPMVSICKDKYFEYDYYHTSLDNLDFIRSQFLVDTLECYLDIVFKLEGNKIYQTLNPKCEPMLGKRGLYPSIGGQLKQGPSETTGNDSEVKLRAINWLMHLSDGETSLLDIAAASNIDFDIILEVAETLECNKLLKNL